MPDATTPGGGLVRPATAADVPALLGLVRALAVYEREPDAVTASEEDLRRALFPDDAHPAAFCHVAEVGGEPGGRLRQTLPDEGAGLLVGEAVRDGERGRERGAEPGADAGAVDPAALEQGRELRHQRLVHSPRPR